MAAQPTEIAIPQPVLEDLAVRLAETRLPPDDASDWEAGASPAYMRELTDYWRDRFDWRAQEAALNRFAHFKVEIGGTPLHYVHERGTGARPLPIVLTHGFPDSFVRFQKLIPLLTDPRGSRRGRGRRLRRGGAQPARLWFLRRLAQVR